MENDHIKINLLMKNSKDRMLLGDFLTDSNYIVNYEMLNFKERSPQVGMIISDETYAEKYLTKILAIKYHSAPIFLPLILLLPKKRKSEFWLHAGFDEVLRTPLMKNELLSKLDILSKLKKFSEKESNIIFNQIPIGIYYMDINRQIISANPAFIKIIGLKKQDEVLNKTLTEIGIETSDNRKKFFHKVLKQKYILGHETTWKKRDGTILYIRENATFFEDANNKVLYLMSTVEDITKVKEFNIEKEKLKTINENILLESQKATAASSVKSAFLAEMSHELRTPLNSIIGFSSLLFNDMAGKMSATQKKFLGNIVTSSTELLQLINNILDLSKIESGKMIFTRKKVMLNELVNGVLERQQPSMKLKNIHHMVSIDKTINEMFVDSASLIQILNNFISNAIKFSHDNSQIDINFYKEKNSKDFFRIEVKDSGIGIKQKDLGKLFVAFSQLEQKNPNDSPGTGLGLALIRKMIEAQGGKVGVDSIEGKGSTFYAILPLVMLNEKVNNREN